MDKQNSLVSVIIPAYNDADHICDAIESALNQTYQDFEIIVIDDGSNDTTKEVLAKYNGKIRYFYQENKGVSAARNLGIREAKGKYIAFLDSDDLWLPTKLEKQINILEKESDVGLIYTEIFLKESSKNRFEVLPSSIGKDTLKDLFQRCYIQISTVVARKKCFDVVGLFDNYFREDYQIWLRIAQEFKHKGIAQPLVIYRKHNKNRSSDMEKSINGTIEVIRGIRPSKKEGITYNLICVRMALLYYHLALDFLNSNNYIKAMWNFCLAINFCPYIGLYIKWEKNKKRSVFYNLFKPYLAIFLCLFKNFQNVIFEKK